MMAPPGRGNASNRTPGRFSWPRLECNAVLWREVAPSLPHIEVDRRGPCGVTAAVSGWIGVRTMSAAWSAGVLLGAASPAALPGVACSERFRTAWTTRRTVRGHTSSWRLGEGEVACGAGGWKRAGAEHMGCGGQAARTHRHGPAERWRAARGRTGTGGPGGRHRTAPALTGRRLRSAALRANTAATGREQSRCRKLLAVHDGKCTCTCRAAACRCAGRRRGAGAGGTWQQNAWAQFVSTASPSQSRQTGQLSSSSAGEAAAMLRDCGVSQVFVRSSTRTRTTTHLN